MTPRELAHTSGMGVLSVYALIREGFIGSTRVGRNIYVPRVEYQRWLSQFKGTKPAA
jgi:excisionase family DNA binding protein